MLIRTEQLVVFEDAAEQRFRAELVGSVKQLTPSFCKLAGDSAVAKAVDHALARAGAYSFTLRGPLRLFVETSAILGCGFDQDPQLPWNAKSLQPTPREDEMLRADRFYRAVMAYAGQVLGEEDAHFHAALKAACAINPTEWVDSAAQARRLLAQIYPQRVSAMPGKSLSSLIGEAEIAAPRCGIAPSLLAALMGLFGHEILTDPLYPWIAEIAGKSGVDAAK